MEPVSDTRTPISARTNRFDLRELAGAFGDLGTLVPFVVAYVSLLKMDAAGVLLAMGTAMIATGLFYRTPFPVQPMKAIGAVAVTQSVGGAMLTPMMVVGAGLVTGVLWLALAGSGLGRRLAQWIPRPALLGVIMGLGFSFMLEGIRMMAQGWIAALALLVVTLALMSRSRPWAMLALIGCGAVLAGAREPSLIRELIAMRPALHLPAFAWPDLSGQDVWLGVLFLALPQLPLTFGNALLAVTEENNRLFPERPVTLRVVSASTGLMNLWSSALGGIPLCHGAGGLAGHAKFGARTGGAPIMLGLLLSVLALFLAESVGTLFRLFPPPMLGVILFIAGAELALGSRDPQAHKEDRFVVISTAAFAMFNVGIAILFGMAAHIASRRGWLRL